MKLLEEIKYRENEYFLSFKIIGTSEEITSLEQKISEYFKKLQENKILFSMSCFGNKEELTVVITSQGKEHIDYWKKYLLEYS